MRSGKTPAAGGSAQVNIDRRKGVCFKRAPVRRRDLAESGSRVLRLPAGSLASFSPLLSFARISVMFPDVLYRSSRLNSMACHRSSSPGTCALSVCTYLVRFESCYKHPTNLFDAMIIVGLLAHSNRIQG